MTTLFVKKLTNIDFSFLDGDRGLVGESWLLDIELTGALDEQGMVLDFGIVKKLIKGYIEQHIDHCLLVPVNYQGCDVLDLGEQLEIAFYLHNGHSIIHRSVGSAVAKIPVESITTGSVRLFLLEKLRSILPKSVTDFNLSLYTEPGLIKSYQYSHGLSKHQGNCQRIAHGHRSGLEILVDQQPSEKWQQYWFECWRDIYIGTSRHLVDDDFDEKAYHHFNYQAPQGDFFLKLPKSMCYLIEEESTVENIAQHLADKIAEKEPGKHIQVRAFEGIGKGAIVESHD